MLMNFQSALNTVSSSRTMRGGAFAMLVLCAALPAVAAPIRVQARQDHSVDSSFSLNFGLQGGVANALISRTDFELEIDGLNDSARFLSYDQDVDPLVLPGPNGPVSTGAIRVHIVPGSSIGTYNRATGGFVTDELYSIEFDGDLSQLGLFSPVILPSQSVGVIDIDSTTVGRVTMNWAGNATVPFDFSYICAIFATFSVTPAAYIEAELVSLVSNMAMSPALRATLLSYLDSAIAALNNNNTRSAVSSLRTFILKTRNAGAINIAAADALILANKANEVISLILFPTAQPMNTPPAPFEMSAPASTSDKSPSDKRSTRAPQ